MTLTACISSRASSPRLSSSACTCAILRRYQSGSSRSCCGGGAAAETLSTRVRPNKRELAVTSTDPAIVRKKSRLTQPPCLSFAIRPPQWRTERRNRDYTGRRQPLKSGGWGRVRSEEKKDLAGGTSHEVP